MAEALVVCPSCSRHVHVGESLCPFCVKSIPRDLQPAPRGPRRPYYGKGATALALASALAASGCSDDTTSSPSADTGTDTQTTQSDAAADTTTPADSAADTATATDADDADVFDSGGGVPLYK